MGWCPGIPADQGVYPRGWLKPSAVVLHRTYGGWGGDYSVGKFGRGPGDPDKTGFHFLVGKDPGQVVQFYSTDIRCNHAAGANSWAIGIEFTGTNKEPLTAWQAEKLAQILSYCASAHGIPVALYDGPDRVAPWRGILGHRWVACDPKYQHTDLVTREDFNRAIGIALPAPAPQEDEMDIIYQPGRANGSQEGYAKLDTAGFKIRLLNKASIAGDQATGLWFRQFDLLAWTVGGQLAWRRNPDGSPCAIDGWSEWIDKSQIWPASGTYSRGVKITNALGEFYRIPWS